MYTYDNSHPKGRLRKSLRNAVVSAVVLLVVFLAAGIIYILVADKNTYVPPVSAKKTDAAPSVVKPTPPAVNAPEGVALETMASPVAAGANTMITVSTNAGSACTILVTYAGGVKSTDSGLAPKNADVYGNASWSWTVDSSVPAGNWPVKVTCTYHGRTGVLQNDLQVTK